MKAKRAVVITTLLGLVLATSFLFAQAPNLLNYQGKLNQGGSPASGSFPMTFAIYDAATGGTPLWTEPWPNVTVTSGVFNVLLGNNSTPVGIPGSVFSGAGDRYLSIAVSGTEIGRFRLTSAAFAIRASQADNVADNAITSAKIQNATITGVDIASSTIGLNNLNFTPLARPLVPGVSNAEITDNAVNSAKIQDGTIQGVDIGNAVIGTNHLNFVPFISSSDYGRSGVTSTLYEGTTPLSSKYFSTSGGNITGTTFITAATAAQFGVVGSSSGEGNSGIYGTNTNANGTGVVGVGNGLTSWTRRTLGSGGAFNGNSWGVAGYAKNTTGERAGGYFSSAGVNAFAHVAYVDANGTIYKIQGTGAVSTVMQTRAGMKALFAPESPEAWFEDIGRGQLINGHARIELDPLFLDVATVSPEFPMNVFIQLNDDCNGVYVKSDNTGFNVHELLNGKSNAEFTYKVVVRWKGYEKNRFPNVMQPQTADQEAVQ